MAKSAEIKATVSKGILTLRIPLSSTPEQSKSGKSLVLASTHGFQTLDCKHNGQEVSVNFNVIQRI